MEEKKECNTEELTYKLKEGQLGDSEGAREITAAFNKFSEIVAHGARHLSDEFLLNPEYQHVIHGILCVIKDRNLKLYILKKRYRARKRMGLLKERKDCCEGFDCEDQEVVQEEDSENE